MKNYQIIYAQPSDCEQIDSLIYNLKKYEAELLNEEINTNFNKTGDLLKDLDSLVIVAKSNEIVLGVGRGFKDSSYMFLSELYVGEKYRKQNIGRRIYEEFVNESRKMQVKSLVIPTLNKNINSQQFYEKIGATKMYIQYEVSLHDGESYDSVL
ncbi:GNAT family N-acetyltransferase [Bacillus thuringiensis]|uniref:GNAT family N-acetyltransferase n=1 Tax=Bacillus thuringiensis TaxID=1428 RepID=UPI000BFD6692|nr:GNAT family N-acetyltransferase [Bacillus thuringiensis]PGM47122.1 hypothetical protein CN949_26790 [Bacillus thuringiensis]